MSNRIKCARNFDADVRMCDVAVIGALSLIRGISRELPPRSMWRSWPCGPRRPAREITPHPTRFTSKSNHNRVESSNFSSFDIVVTQLLLLHSLFAP